MHRFLVALVALVGGQFLSPAQAQVMLGAKAGYNLTTMWFDKWDTSTRRTFSEDGKGGGFHCGMFMRMKSNGPIALRLELLYSQRRSDLNYTGPESDFSYYQLNGTVTASYSYVEIPLLVAIRPAGGFDLQIGLSPSVLLTADAKDQWTLTADDPWNEDLNGEVTGSDFPRVAVELVPGLSYDFMNGVHLSARYVIGFEDFDLTDSSTIQQAVFQFSAGYCFRGKRTS